MLSLLNLAQVSGTETLKTVKDKQKSDGELRERLTSLGDLFIQVIHNLGMWFFDVPGYPRVNLTSSFSFLGAPSTALMATKGPVEDSWPNPSLFFRHKYSQQGSVIFEKALRSGWDRW